MDRDEQRRLLRQKIAARRQQRVGGGGASASEALQRDPMSALLSMGLSDPSALAHATRLAKNTELLRHASRAMKTASRNEAKHEAKLEEEEGEEEEEEAPPLTSHVGDDQADAAHPSVDSSDEEAPP